MILTRVTNLLCLLLGIWLAASAHGQFPTIQSVSPPAGTVTQLTQITVTFNEPVRGVASDDLLLNGIPCTGVSGSGAAYTFSFTQPTYDKVQISWDPGQAIYDFDTPSNRFNAAGLGATWQYTLVDVVSPVVTLLTPVAGSTVRSLSQVEVVFSESVIGVDAADLLVNGQAASRLNVVSANHYLFEFSPPTNGLVQFQWAAGHNIQDWAASANAFSGSGWNVTLDSSYQMPKIRINEFMVGNVNTNSGLRDVEGELQDWIEIYNYGTNSANLAGCSLTDDSGDPGRWVFPAISLAANQYLVVLASGKDRRTVTGTNHTNFKMSLYGEYLGLFNNESPRTVIHEFRPQYPEQRNDYSYGLTPSNEWRYFGLPTYPPTPRGPNGNSAINGVVPKPHVNVHRGYFEQPFTLVANCSLAGAQLRYTTDGTEPSATTGLVYTGPLRFTNTTTLRMAAFAANMLPSTVETHTYIFLNSVVTQPNNPSGFPSSWGYNTNFAGSSIPADYEMDPEIVTNSAYAIKMKPALKSLPVVCLSMAMDDLFSTNKGIYANPEPAPAVRYLWERPCSAELFLTNGQSAFQINCGIRIEGNASRTPTKTPKHPFRLLFRGRYGAGTLDYPLFPDSAIASFDTIVLRSDFNYHWVHWDGNQRLRGAKIRDAWTKDAYLAMGQPAGHARSFHLYINGVYWGVYNFGERIDATFGAAYLGGQPDEYDAIASTPTEAINGDLTAYIQMTNTARMLTNIAQQSVIYSNLATQLDITNFVDYTLLNFFGANQDWNSDHNWNAFRRRTVGTDTRVHYTIWDGEQLLSEVWDDRTGTTDLPSHLHTNLINSSEYMLLFADRAQKHLFNNGALSTNANVARWLRRAAEIDPAIVAESARWGDYRRDVHSFSSGPYELYTRDDFWKPEIDRLVNDYFPTRNDVFLSQLQSVGLYPSLSAPVYRQHGGRVARNYQLYITNDFDVYYTLNGHDPRFGGILYLAGSTTPITLTNSVVVKARASNEVWSALAEAEFTVAQLGVLLRITEINYNPLEGDACEYLEIKNLGNTPVDLSYYSLDGVNYTFPVGKILAAGAVLVLASDLSTNTFAARYPGVKVDGYFNGSLSNGGQRIAIRGGTPDMPAVTSVTYNDKNGWPKAADGLGYALEIIDPLGDPNDSANWRVSATTNGSPGLVGAAPTVPVIRFNEIMADNLTVVSNTGTFPDWVELYNSGATATNLAGWSLTDDSNLRKFVFPDTNLSAGGYLVIWCDSATNTTPGWHSGFGISKGGQSLFLYNAITQLVDTVGIGQQLTDLTVGRVGTAWRLTQPTPGATNVAVVTGAATNLIINEWMANSIPGSEDWVEIFNRSSNSPVALQGFYFGVSNALFQVESLSFIPPHGYARFWADELPGSLHLDFKLPKSSSSLALYDDTGALINRVNYGVQIEGVSQGRLPDGNTVITNFAGSASPGTTNYVLNFTGPKLNELMARNKFAVPSPEGGGVYPDWIELYNPYSTNFSLTGMALSDSVSQPQQWLFPSNSVINGNSYLVVWFDETRRASTAWETNLNTGFALSSDSGGVYFFNAGGQVVDQVEYGFQVANQSIGMSAGKWQLLQTPTLGATNSAVATLGSATNLCINEWMADPASGDDWFELFNKATLPVALSGLMLADSPAVVFMSNTIVGPLSFVAPQGWVLFAADGNLENGRHHAGFSLDAAGEMIVLYQTNGTVIDAVYFGQQTTNISQGHLPDGGTNIVSFSTTPTPGEGNYLPLTNVVINEVLSHTDAPFQDAIELFNVTGGSVNIGGWYISNDAENLKKYQIANGAMIAGSGFRVYYEKDFNSNYDGIVPGFTFNSAHGDKAWLCEADSGGNLTGYRSLAQFSGAMNGVSFGRVVTSVGVDYAATTQNTFGADNAATTNAFTLGTGLSNAAPRIGPVVISELMYHPPDVVVGGSPVDNVLDEFIELHNVTSNTVALYHPSEVTNTWKLSGAVDYVFPTNISIAPKGYVLVVNFDPVTNTAQLATFRTLYGVGTNVLLFGPFGGKLANDGESVELYQPDAVQKPPHPDAGYLPYALVDKVDYRDTAPWPSGAVDGGGLSLQRRADNLYGNEPTNWVASPTTVAMAYGAVAPTINQHPTNLLVRVGANATFNVVATGTSPMNYRWLFNTTNPVGTDTASLILNNVRTNHAGVYTVLISNLAGMATSLPAWLVVDATVKLGTVNMQTNGFRLVLQGPLGTNYYIEGSSNLAAWVRLITNNSPDGTVDYTDTKSTNHSHRFYRAVTAP